MLITPSHIYMCFGFSILIINACSCSLITSKELISLEHLNPGEDNPISCFVPGVLVKFGWNYDAEVCAL